MKNEFQLIERLKSLIPRQLQGKYLIGDDTAILPSSRGRSLLFTTDCIVEGIDFKRGRGGATPEQIGHKALAVNLSDIAAMGGTPLAFVASWGIPAQLSQKFVERIAKGIIRLAKRFHVSWVGGDLSRANRLFISIALLGEGKSKKIIQRKGAKPGDLIYVTGKLGGSIRGKHLNFTPRLKEAEFLAHQFHPRSMIDLSDGLIQDLEHLLKESKVGARINFDRIPISEAAWKLSGGSYKKALKAALTDGEDFELLFTLPSKEAKRLEGPWRLKVPGVALTSIGEVTSDREKIEWRDKKRKIQKLWFQKKGFTHF